MDKRNIILADKQVITSMGLRYLIDKKIDGVGEVLDAGNKLELIKLLSDNEDSIVVLDYTLFDFASVNELYMLSERYPHISWMLFSEELSDSFLRRMLVNGLYFSIVCKMAPSDEIELALMQTVSYQSYLNSNLKEHLRMLERSLESSSDHNLTITEKEVLKEMALGKTTKEIAVDRTLSVHTIMTHRKNIFRKLQVNNVHEATKYAIRAGIVDVSEYYI